MDEHGPQQYTPRECAEILTYGGEYFRFDDPDDTRGMDIGSIAHALALTNRFGGHTRTPYSVAQHSVHVSYLCDPEDALWGLMHDAPEAYITDVVRPAKALLPDYQALEAAVMRKIARYYGLPGDDVPESVHRADLRMCATEKRDLIPHGREHEWHLPYPPRDEPVYPLDWPLARYAFLKRYYDLVEGSQL